jgi:hypothetical protein
MKAGKTRRITALLAFFLIFIGATLTTFAQQQMPAITTSILGYTVNFGTLDYGEVHHGEDYAYGLTSNGYFWMICLNPYTESFDAVSYIRNMDLQITNVETDSVNPKTYTIDGQSGAIDTFKVRNATTGVEIAQYAAAYSPLPGIRCYIYTANRDAAFDIVKTIHITGSGTPATPGNASKVPEKKTNIFMLSGHSVQIGSIYYGEPTVKSDSNVSGNYSGRYSNDVPLKFIWQVGVVPFQPNMSSYSISPKDLMTFSVSQLFGVEPNTFYVQEGPVDDREGAIGTFTINNPYGGSQTFLWAYSLLSNRDMLTFGCTDKAMFRDMTLTVHAT